MPTAENPPPASATVISFRPGRRHLIDEVETPVGLPASVPQAARIASTAPAIDLTGKPKVWLVIGPGRSGKTMLLRWAFEMTANRGDVSTIWAAADPQNRSLGNYVEDVAEPPTNDGAQTARWLEDLLRHTMATKTSAMVDLGGGDTSLHKLLSIVPTLADDIDSAGVVPVAVYAIGPRIDDLASLASFEAIGFRPKATALVLNEGLADPSMHREDAFARVLNHSAYRAALTRGAVEVWLPRLDQAVAQDIEAKRIGFLQARDAISPQHRRVTPLGPFDRAHVRKWLEALATELAPVQSWLPA
jgi:hypothetical protein